MFVGVRGVLGGYVKDASATDSGVVTGVGGGGYVLRPFCGGVRCLDLVCFDFWLGSWAILCD